MSIFPPDLYYLHSCEFSKEFTVTFTYVDLSNQELVHHYCTFADMVDVINFTKGMRRNECERQFYYALKTWIDSGRSDDYSVFNFQIPILN